MAFRGGLRGAVRRADVMAALLSTTTGAALGLSAVLAAAAFVAEIRGLLAPGAWAAGVGAGLAWVAVAALVAGLSKRELTGETAREVMIRAFGLEVGRYPETARPVRALVETRLRLAEAVEAAPAAMSDAARAFETGVDQQIADLIPMAQKAARHRAGLSFHSAMASAAGQRRDDAGPALASQRAAAEDLARAAEAERVSLEEGVAALSGLVTRASLALARGQGAEVAALTAEIRARRLAESLGAPSPPPSLSPPPPPPAAG